MMLVGDAAAANVGQWLNTEIATFLQLRGGHGGAPAHFHVGGDDEIQIVVDGLHVGPVKVYKH